MKQKPVENLPKCTENNHEILLNFVGPFQNAKKAKKNLIGSGDHYSGWPEANFLRKPNTEKVLEFLRNCIARHGIPPVIRTDPAINFRSKRFKEFWQKRLIQHIESPVGDHRGNGKIERLIRTINENIYTCYLVHLPHT